MTHKQPTETHDDYDAVADRYGIDAESIEREAELRMEREALHRLNGGWRDYPY